MENASYAIQGLKLRAPDELERLGVQFSRMSIGDAKEKKKGGADKPVQKLIGGGETGVVAEGSPVATTSHNNHNNATTTPAEGEKGLVCAFCGVHEDGVKIKMQVCSRCKETAYCSREHQRGHWQVHKATCKQK